VLFVTKYKKNKAENMSRADQQIFVQKSNIVTNQPISLDTGGYNTGHHQLAKISEFSA